MKKVYVIRKVDDTNPISGYWNSAMQNYDIMQKATQYSTEEEAYNRIATKFPEGIYQILPIIVKQ